MVVSTVLLYEAQVLKLLLFYINNSRNLGAQIFEWITAAKVIRSVPGPRELYMSHDLSNLEMKRRHGTQTT